MLSEVEVTLDLTLNNREFARVEELGKALQDVTGLKPTVNMVWDSEINLNRTGQGQSLDVVRNEVK